MARGRGGVTEHAGIGADRMLRTDGVGARQRLFAIVGRAARGPRKGGRDDAIAERGEGAAAHGCDSERRAEIIFVVACFQPVLHVLFRKTRSEEHTSELQSLMRISYAVFCLKKKKIQN